MPRLRNKGTGCVVNVDDVTAARLARREFDMGEWEPLDAAPTDPEPTGDAEPVTTEADAEVTDDTAAGDTTEPTGDAEVPVPAPKPTRRRK